jgi:hypothetical protein
MVPVVAENVVLACPAAIVALEGTASAVALLPIATDTALEAT